MGLGDWSGPEFETRDDPAGREERLQGTKAAAKYGNNKRQTSDDIYHLSETVP